MSKIKLQVVHSENCAAKRFFGRRGTGCGCPKTSNSLTRRTREMSKRFTAPQKRSARKAVAAALKSGTLARQTCQFTFWRGGMLVPCGRLFTEAHHPDYSRPLLVRWLCRYHHQRKTHGFKPGLIRKFIDRHIAEQRTEWNGMTVTEQQAYLRQTLK